MQGNKVNKKTLKALLVVLLSKDIGYSKTTGKKLKSQIYLEKLDERIRGITFEEPETTCDQENYDEYENIDAEEETDEAEAYERDEIEDVAIGDRVNVDEEIEDDSLKVSETWKMWAQKLYSKSVEIAAESVDGDVVNAMYNNKAAKKVVDLMTYLAIWTGVMREHFNKGEIAASAGVV